MPRRNKTPILSPIRAYYAFERKRDIQKEMHLENKARKRRAVSKRQIERQEFLDATTEKRLNEQIDRFLKHPSKLAVSLLAGMVRSSRTPKAVKARAAAVILQWSNGDFSDGRRRRQQARGVDGIRP